MDARNINYRKWLAITALSLVITAVVELISHSQSFSELCRQAAVSWLGVWIGYELKVKHMAKKGAKHDSDQ